MGVDELITIDTLSLADFQRTLQARLDEANAMLTTLTAQRQDTVPALGGFQDAADVAARYRTLHEEFTARVERLVNAIAVAQSGVGLLVERYETFEELTSAQVQDIAKALRPIGKVLHGD